ncbi:MAG: acyl-CoA dehydratase activase [Planctomycetota bacterium]|jgi:benzoyl-CoA reductase subunit D
MITAGIDVGAKWVKVVVLRDGEVIGQSKVLTGFQQQESAEQALQTALAAAGVGPEKIHGSAATGAGREDAPGNPMEVTEVTAAAMGAVHLDRSARTVIDVGAEEGRAIKTTNDGRVIDFAINEKCAAGSGAFTEAMARALETPVDQIGALSMESTRPIPMNAQCAVFAESEVVSLLHANTPKADIARAVHDAIANRVASMARKVGINEAVMVIGGVAKNAGFVASIQRELDLEVKVPKDPDFVSALGAALHVARAAALGEEHG